MRVFDLTEKDDFYEYENFIGTGFVTFINNDYSSGPIYQDFPPPSRMTMINHYTSPQTMKKESGRMANTMEESIECVLEEIALVMDILEGTNKYNSKLQMKYYANRLEFDFMRQRDLNELKRIEIVMFKQRIELFQDGKGEAIEKYIKICVDGIEKLSKFVLKN